MLVDRVVNLDNMLPTGQSVDLYLIVLYLYGSHYLLYYIELEVVLLTMRVTIGI
jgi:hypothetical protein